MTDFQSRPAAVYVLPLQQEVSTLEPAQVILDFPGKGTLDIGALCYVRRDSEGHRRKRDQGKRVAPSSLDVKRVECIRAVIQYISIRFSHSGRSPTTVYGETSLGIVTFLDWADSSGHHRALYDESSARAAFSAYIDNLWHKYRRRDIASSTAARLCKNTLEFLSDFLDVDDLHRGLNLPKKTRGDARPTLPPIDNAQARAISLCSALFDGLTGLVIENRPFPHSIEMPKYLGWDQNILWIFPLVPWFRIPSVGASMSNEDNHALAYNFAQGRISEIDELLEFYPTRRHAVQSRRRAVVNLENSNSNPRALMRIALAMQAHHVFTILFLANTGMNLAQMLELEWSEEYEVSIVRQKFNVVKWRARGKVQSFEIQSVFFPDFKIFLELRKYVLNGRPCPWLFFSLSKGHKGDPQKIVYSTPRQMYQRLQRFDPSLPNITPRQWRLADVDWMLRQEVPIAVAADVVQNTEETLKASYATGSPEIQKAEMTVFFEKVSSVVLNEAQEIEGSREGPVGACISFGKPKALIEGGSRKPDCRNPEGCLFCDKYKAHADERDTRKLISCRYCIQKTASLASSVEHFDNVFGPILSRINQLLAEIGRRATDLSMVARVEQSVEELGELDDYWAAKLELLLNLDLISP